MLRDALVRVVFDTRVYAYLEYVPFGIFSSHIWLIRLPYLGLLSSKRPLLLQFSFSSIFLFLPLPFFSFLLFYLPLSISSS
jgi:hypothetical protein